MPATYIIGIDLGGTNIKGGVFDADRRLVLRRSIATEADRGFEHVFDRLVGLIRDLIRQAGLKPLDVRGLGLGTPGPLSHRRGFIYGSPNLPGWDDIPLRQRLQAAVGLPVVLDNDANVAALGEFVAGAGRGTRHMVMLTLGTGIGGGVIADGRLLRGHFENAGELGHTIVYPGGEPCPCGQNGCLERYASANAVGRRAAEAIRLGESSTLVAPLRQHGRLTSRDVVEAVRAGDTLAVRVWGEACEALAIGCVNFQHTLNPQRVVLGGGMANAGELLIERVREKLAALSWNLFNDRPEIVLAECGEDAGIIGAAALVETSDAD